MKSLLPAGILSLTLHGALLLTTLGMHEQQPPHPLQQMICIAVEELREEKKITRANEAMPPNEDARLDRPATRPDKRQKQITTAKKMEKQPAVTPMATDPEMKQEQEENAALVPEPVVAGEKRETSFATAALCTAGSTGSGNSEQQTTEASPLYRKNPPPDYPAVARRRGIEGTVLLDVLVSSLGTANEVRIAGTSGHELLDHAAVTAAKGWTFLPGKRGEQPVDMWVRVPIRFALHD